ncbi:hypothetical protein QN277_011111 [Acacia crassicarpa]|uniref:HMA domain-containing protein n=1 Tax=Acacia crassicarpa TaxID=499986 RepID=A0AAE1MXY3_9FABA|nr:hypothetical protein QN277_011111 [Acacia crassicarpa]
MNLHFTTLNHLSSSLPLLHNLANFPLPLIIVKLLASTQQYNSQMTMKKIVLKLELQSERTKQKVMKTTSGISGVESVNVDMKDMKLTVTGEIDPVKVVGKLRKLCHTEIVSVGAAKESEKKAEEKIENIAKAIVTAPLSYSHVYYPPPPYYVGTVEEYPNSGCVIC